MAEAAVKETVAIKVGAEASIHPKIDASLQEHPVCVIGKSTCVFTIEAQRFLEHLDVPFFKLHVDIEPEGDKLWDALKTATGQKTVPYVYVKSELIGGCTDVKAGWANGSLEQKLRTAGASPRSSVKKQLQSSLGILKERPFIITAFFDCPEMVDDRYARWTAFFSCLVAILVAIYYASPSGPWIMLGLTVDFCLRVFGGGNISTLGALAGICVALMDTYTSSKPFWKAGISIQFANLCGVMFSVPATTLFLCQWAGGSDWNNANVRYAGLAFTIALAGATGLNAAGWCAGCWMFGLGVQFGLLPQSIYKVFTSVRAEAQYTWEEANKVLDLPEPTIKTKNLIDVTVPTTVDYVYKDKSDDYGPQDFHIIKHVKITHFLALMGTAGLACTWKLASSSSQFMNAPQSVYWSIALGTAAVYLVFLVLYLTKCVLYPQKVIKEWQCPLRGNSFVVPSIILVLFAYLIQDYNIIAARVFFWIGAPTSLFVSLLKWGSWIGVRKDMEHVNPAWMVSPVSAFVVALVGPGLDNNYLPAMQFWFGFAFLSWLLLSALTFHKTVLHPPADDRLRPLLAIWVAAPAVMAVAYLSCFRPAQASGDFIFLNLFWFSISLTLIFIFSFMRPFFGRIKFDMAYWAAGFPAAALSLVSTQYASVVPGRVSAGIAYAALAAASAINAILALHTLSGLIRRKIFVPDYKWGPLSYMRLTHEAFRTAIARLLVKVEALANASSVEPSQVEDVVDYWRLLHHSLEVHAKHEDQVIFAEYSKFFPQVSKESNEEHEHHEAVFREISNALTSAMNAKTASQGIATANDLIKEFAKDIEQHLLGEELNLAAMPRKYVNLALSKQVLAKCWDMETADTWREILPWTLNNLPMLQQRVRFLKTFLWAVPERAQQIGLMVAAGVDDVQWLRITNELPEIIPRGADGYERFY